MYLININTFLKYTIYLGHKATNSLVLSSWFFYKLKKQIWIINILKTIIFVKLIYKFLIYLVNHNLPIWFINFEKSKKYLFKKYAMECGEFHCTEKWLRGLLTNYKIVQRVLIISKYKYKDLSYINYIKKYWNYTRLTWPRSIFLSNISLNYAICNEASNMMLPIIAMVDTNVKSYYFTYPIPANDDSIDSVCFILKLITRKLLILKFKKLLLWYQKYYVKACPIKKVWVQLNKKMDYLKNLFKKYNKFQSTFYIKRFLVFKIWYSTQLQKNYYFQHFISTDGWMDNMLSLKNRRYLIKKKIRYKFKKSPFYKAFIDNSIYMYKLQAANNIKNVPEDWNSISELLIETLSLQKNKEQDNFYWDSFMLSKWIKESRLYYESYFINKPTQYNPYYYFQYIFKNLDMYHEIKRLPSINPVFLYNEWYCYKKKLDEQGIYYQKHWWKHGRHKFLKNLRSSSYKFSASNLAIVFDYKRFFSNKFTLFDHIKKYKFHVFKYLLVPFFKRHWLKGLYFARNQWYHARYPKKLDNNFKMNKNYKKPSTTFQYYTDWFDYICRESEIENIKNTNLDNSKKLRHLFKMNPVIHYFK